METVKAEVILRGAAARAGLSRDEISGDLLLDLRDALSRRVREGWEYHRWPELMRWEQRFFRKVWSEAAGVTAQVAARTEWFYPVTEEYYVALRANLTEPADPDGTVNGPWALLAEEQGSPDDWDATLTYDPGDKVYYPVTGLIYACHVATTAGLVPTTAANWWPVPDFDRYVDRDQVLADTTAATEIGTVFRVTRKNPKTAGGRSERPVSVSWWTSENGIQVGEDVPWVWLEFRLRPPVLDGELWDVSTAYAAGESAYYEGDFWECVTAAAANESPASNPAKWALKEIPRFLERFLVVALYADYLEMEGQMEKARAEESRAQAELGRLVLVSEGQESDTVRAVVAH